MKKFALSFFLSFLPCVAQAADSAWVQATAGGYEARLVSAAADCPQLHTDKGDVAMAMRAPASANFPLVCGAVIPVGTSQAKIGDMALPLPVANPQRTLV